MQNLKFKPSALALSIAASLFYSTSSFAAYLEKGKGDYIISEDHPIHHTSSGDAAIQVGKDDYYKILDNGKIELNVEGASGVLGISAAQTGILDLGSGSKISISSLEGTKDVYGIRLDNSSQINAETLNVDITSESGKAAVLGLRINDAAKVKLLGNNFISVKNITDPKNAYAVSLKGSGNGHAQLDAANLHIESSGQGLKIEENSIVNLTGKTKITAGSEGILVLGDFDKIKPSPKVTIESLELKSTNPTNAGLWIMGGGEVEVGAGSTIESNNNAIYAQSSPFIGSELDSTIRYVGGSTAATRNMIKTFGGAGATAHGKLAEVELVNTDIYTDAEQGNTIGLRAINGGTIKAENISVTAVDVDKNYQNVAAVVTQGNGSTIYLSGHTAIDVLKTANKMALQIQGTDSHIEVKDTANIQGDVTTLGNQSSITLDLTKNSIFTGAAKIIAEQGGTTYSDSVINIALTDSTWQMTKSSDITTLALNAGSVINLNTQADNPLSTTNTLTIQKDYQGDNGMIIFNARLEDDQSHSDKLIIQGEALGKTIVQVNNLGGQGTQTTNGIHLIQTGSSESDATFYLEGDYVSAGAYDYSLNLKKSEMNNNETFDNWYLKSQLHNGEDPENPVYTPDMGSYLAVEAMGNTLFNSRLEDREGASRYQNLTKDYGNAWVRVSGGYNQFNSMSEQLKTKGNSVMTQMGMGLVTLGTEEQYGLGFMGGYAHYSGKTKSQLTDRSSKASIDGYSLGLYGTWYAHPVEKQGAYIDSWVLWNSFKNKVDTADQHVYKYDSSGVTASIETGGDYLIHKNGKTDWWIQPQAQLIYQGVHADRFKDIQAADISHGSDNLQARLGFKTYLDISSSLDAATRYRPYIALNFIHNTNPYAVRIDDVEYTTQGSSNLGEVKLGVEGSITPNSQVWLNTSYVAGSHSHQAYQGNIGWKYNF